MKLIKIQYKKQGQLLTRYLKILVEDNLTVEEVREIVLDEILGDLDVTKYSWEVKENETRNYRK